MNSAWRRRVVLGSVFARFGCSALLLIAAVLKAYQLFRDPALGVIHGSRWLEAGLIEYETLLAAWLLSGMWPHWGRRIAFATFLAFGCYAFYLGLSGEASCGCYGPVHVSPWGSFSIDAALVLLLFVWKPQQQRTILSLPILFAVLSIPIVLIAVWRPGIEPFVFLEPEEWIGKPFPLTNDIDIAEHEQLSRGAWILVFYRHDCPKCRQALLRYERLAEQQERLNDRTKIALIELPPYGSGEPAAGPYCRLGRLSNNKEWIMATPAEVRLLDGNVTAAASKLDAEAQ